jgi:hypothetical protein
MIDFQKALAERRLLQTLFENTYGFALVSGLLGDAADAMAIPVGEALDMAESLRARGMLTLAVCDEPGEVRAWLTERGIAAVEGEERQVRSRTGYRPTGS